MYVIGKTGVGKSTLLATLIRQDLEAGNGLALLDPHGSLIEHVLSEVPAMRRSDIIHFNVADAVDPLALNPLECVPSSQRPVTASALIEVFKKIWAESWGPRVEYILRNALIALLDQPQATLADIGRLLDDRDFRRNAAGRVANAHVRQFWLREYETYPARFRTEAIAPLQNKVGAFLANPILSRILSQPRSSFNVRDVMDGSKILLVNLAKGAIGEDSAMLLGSLLVNQFGIAALSRTDIPEEGRRDFYVYLDEFQNFTTLSLANMLSELRKYRVNLILAHQYLAQLDPKISDAIFGNVGTIVSFRVGARDAEVLEKEFRPEIGATDLVNLPNYNIYLKLMVDGVVARPFSAETCEEIHHLGGNVNLRCYEVLESGK